MNNELFELIGPLTLKKQALAFSIAKNIKKLNKVNRKIFMNLLLHFTLIIKGEDFLKNYDDDHDCKVFL